MASRDERIANLAATLKSSGVAKSDAQARMMAEEMIGVEEHVQKRFDEEHTKAQEFLSTSKNLGTAGTIKYRAKQPVDARPSVGLITPIETQSMTNKQSGSKPEHLPADNIALQGTVLNRPDHKHEFKPDKTEAPILKTLKTVDEDAHEKIVQLEPVHTDTNFGNKLLKDLMLDQIQEDQHEIIPIEDMKPVEKPPEHMAEPEDMVVPELDDTQESAADTESTETEQEPEDQAPLEEPIGLPEQAAINSSDLPSDDLPQDDLPSDKAQSDDLPSDALSDETAVESVEAKPALDADKLLDMLEEEGKLEERTREIKEKPKNVKPKEDYEENNIDLSSMFNVNK